MRPARALLLPFSVAFGLALGPAQAQTATTETSAPPTITGLWLTTDYPALTERLGEDVEIGLTLQNRNLPPRRVELSVSGLPDGWKAEIEGAGKPVTAAFVQPDESQQLTLKITPAEGAKPGDYPFTVTGRADGETLSLPVALALAEAEASVVKLEPKLPALRGTPSSSFDFQIKVTNDSPDDQVFNLVADAPPGFQVTFKEQYGSQELTSIPVKANESKDVTLSVKPPQDVAAGQYQVAALIGSAALNGTTQLMLDVTGQPKLSLAGPEGRLSGDATAGKERAFTFTLRNEGTAPAKEVKFTAAAPPGWKVTFNPETVPGIDAGQELEVSAAMTPSERAIAGDYIVVVRGNGDGASADASFRVTVLTSTMWGIAGLGVIGAAVLVLAVAVARYGRR
jgi:uncharacterized repeat protein (TIGR01451 family)